MPLSFNLTTESVCNKLLFVGALRATERDREREHELENSSVTHCPVPSIGPQGLLCLEETVEESTDLGNESMLLGRFPKDSLLDNTESTVSGLWGQGQRQVILGLWSRTQKNQSHRVLRSLRLP